MVRSDIPASGENEALPYHLHNGDSLWLGPLGVDVNPDWFIHANDLITVGAQSLRGPRDADVRLRIMQAREEFFGVSLAFEAPHSPLHTTTYAQMKRLFPNLFRLSSAVSALRIIANEGYDVADTLNAGCYTLLGTSTPAMVIKGLRHNSYRLRGSENLDGLVGELEADDY